MARVRFAPSPTGNLHIGSARTALYNWLFAKANNGVFMVRIEDTDLARSSKDFEAAILNDLEWLGLKWDEGPGIKGPFGPYHQSKRFDLYRKKVSELVEKGFAYECYCQPEELEEARKKAFKQRQMPRYSGKCLNLTKEQIDKLKAKGQKPSIRFKVPEGQIEFDDMIHGKTTFENKTIGDFVILRSDGAPTFHLSVVVDDGEMKITHVIRGDDHLPNTPKHIMLFMALGYDTPQFGHHSLIRGKDGTKLSKRHGATAVYDYRTQGYLPEAIDNYLALLSWTPPNEIPTDEQGKREILTREDLIKYFKVEGLSKSPAIFDIDKLKWLNGQHIRRLNTEVLTDLCTPYLKQAGIDTGTEKLSKICSSIKDNLITLNEVPDYAEVYFQEPIEYTGEIADYVANDMSKIVFQTALKLLTENNLENPENSKEFLSSIASELKSQGIKGKNVYMPLRAALTAKTTGPELYYLISIFGKEKVKTRLEKAIEQK